MVRFFGGSVTTAGRPKSRLQPSSRIVSQHRAIGTTRKQIATHLYSPFPTRQTSRFCPPLDLLLVPPARHHPLLALVRWQLVSHRKLVRRRRDVHLLARRRQRLVRIGVVCAHGLHRGRERRAHRLLSRLVLRWRLSLAILETDGRQVQRRQRHVGASGRRAIGLLRLLALGRRVGVGGLHGGRRVGVRRWVGLRLLSGLGGVLLGHARQFKLRRAGEQGASNVCGLW